MLKANWHQFQILTKRADRLAELNEDLPWADHIWMGVSVENEKVRDRIDHLRGTNAKVKFLSLEPLIGPLPNLDLSGIDWVIVGGESGPGARPMKPEWYGTCATNANLRVSLSSSNNGAESSRAAAAGF